ncbi:MAG: GTP cyclohydrolase I FolE [Myxococcota bacterium]
MTAASPSTSENTATGGVPQTHPFDAARFEKAIGELLAACGIAEDNPHMAKTRARVRALWQDRLLSGYQDDPATVLGEGFEDGRQDLVLLRGIAVHGICPHHLVPFRGVAHVAYLPGGRLHGFGRIARMVDALGHRLTYQEWMTRDIVDTLLTAGKARGAACIIEAEQLCLLLGENRRGDERVVTQAVGGCFADDEGARTAMLQMLRPRAA